MRRAHGAAEIGVVAASLQRTVHRGPFGNQGDDGIRRLPLEFSAVGLRQARHIAGKLNYRSLHPKTDPQVGDSVLSSIAYRLNFALYPTLAKAAGNQDCIHPL